MERVFRFKSWFLNAPCRILYMVGLIIAILQYGGRGQVYRIWGKGVGL